MSLCKLVASIKRRNRVLLSSDNFPYLISINGTLQIGKALCRSEFQVGSEKGKINSVFVLIAVGVSACLLQKLRPLLRRIAFGNRVFFLIFLFVTLHIWHCRIRLNDSDHNQPL